MENPEFPCHSIREVPLLQNDLRYFVSFHEDVRYRMTRMLLNFFLPIAEKWRLVPPPPFSRPPPRLSLNAHRRTPRMIEIPHV